MLAPLLEMPVTKAQDVPRASSQVIGGERKVVSGRTGKFTGNPDIALRVDKRHASINRHSAGLAKIGAPYERRSARSELGDECLQVRAAGSRAGIRSLQRA